MSWSQELRTYIQTQLERRKPSFGSRLAEIQETLAQCGEDERLVLAYFYATMPIVDAGDYPPAYFLETARHGLKVRRELPWCGALPEQLFLQSVAYPRINTEELSSCRELFWEKLAPRVRGLSLEEAIVEVNRWCAEEATYRSTDGRTSSPLEVYQRGYGRCGEESTLLVTALRSVGIAARQVYVPWWSHCDDNHAWVEAFDGQSWRYLGACEPEPVLDRGWFTHAAARAVMVHTRTFVQGSREETAFLFPCLDPLDWDIQEGVAVENITARYGSVKRMDVSVADQEGNPVSGAWVAFSVMNMAAPQEVARRRTDGEGRVSLRLGKGTVLLTAWVPGRPESLAEEIAAPEDGTARLVLGRTLAGQGQGDFLAPADAGLTVPALSPRQEEWRENTLSRAAALRERKRQARSLPASPSGKEGRVWRALTEKDRDGTLSQELMEDALSAFTWEAGLPAQAFQEGVLSPRIGLEVLTPWRQLLKDRFSPEEAEAFRRTPQRLWEWVETAAPLDEGCYSGLWGTPAGMLQVGAATERGQRLLFCAACRALGIPAKLGDGGALVWGEEGFRPLGGEAPSARLCLSAPENHPGLEGQSYTLARRGGEGWQPVSAGDVPERGARKLPLLPGEYRLWTANRMPGGSLLCQWETFRLEEKSVKEIALSFREGNLQDMLECCPLPPFFLKDEEGKAWSSQELLAQAPLTVLCFLEVNREPTEHLLNELREAAAALEKTGVPLCLALPELAQRDDPTLEKALRCLPWAVLYQCDFSTAIPTLARRLYLDPDQLPLAVLANLQGEGLYGCGGYNVGTAGLLLRLIGGLQALARQENPVV